MQRSSLRSQRKNDIHLTNLREDSFGYFSCKAESVCTKHGVLSELSANQYLNGAE